MPRPEDHREFLVHLARARIPFDLRGRVDPSDLVQETLACAHRDLPKFRGQTPAEMAGWLRGMLACRLIDAIRRLGRDATLSLDEWDRSSARIADFLAADQPSPSERLRRVEDGEAAAKEVAGLLARLTEPQKEAVLLRHGEGWPVERIAQHMGRTPQAIGGLLRHGLRRLREARRRTDEP